MQKRLRPNYKSIGELSEITLPIVIMKTIGKAIGVEQIKDDIRKLNRTDKIEICRWIDHEAAVDLLSRIGIRKSNRSKAHDEPAINHTHAKMKSDRETHRAGIPEPEILKNG